MKFFLPLLVLLFTFPIGKIQAETSTNPGDKEYQKLVDELRPFINELKDAVGKMADYPTFTTEEEIALTNENLSGEILWNTLIKRAREKGVAVQNAIMKATGNKEEARRKGFDVYEIEMKKSLHYLNVGWDVDGVYNLNRLLQQDQANEKQKRDTYNKNTQQS